MQSKRIVVVDNDAPLRAALANLLRAAGYEVDCHASAESFLASGEFSSTDCLLLDVRMRGMSGEQLQQHLARVGAGIPIIFITAQTATGVRIGPLSARRVEVLEKPFTDEELIDAIERSLRPAAG
jgi:FixJ family two-component response regulator